MGNFIIKLDMYSWKKQMKMTQMKKRKKLAREELTELKAPKIIEPNSSSKNQEILISRAFKGMWIMWMWTTYFMMKTTTLNYLTLTTAVLLRISQLRILMKKPWKFVKISDFRDNLWWSVWIEEILTMLQLAITFWQMLVDHLWLCRVVLSLANRQLLILTLFA